MSELPDCRRSPAALAVPTEQICGCVGMQSRSTSESSVRYCRFCIININWAVCDDNLWYNHWLCIDR